MALQDKPTFPWIFLLRASICCLLVTPQVVSGSNGTTTTTIAAPSHWTGSQDGASEQPQLLSSSTSSSSSPSSTLSNATTSSSSSTTSSSSSTTSSINVSSSTEDGPVLPSTAGTREETPGIGTVPEERSSSPSTAGTIPTADPTERGAATTATASIAPRAISPPPGAGDAGGAWDPAAGATAGVSNSTGAVALPTTAGGTVGPGVVATARAPSSAPASRGTAEQTHAAAAAATTAPVDFPAASPRATATSAVTTGVARPLSGEGLTTGPDRTAAAVATPPETAAGAVPSRGAETVDAASTALPSLPVALAVTRPMRTSSAAGHWSAPTEPRPGHAGTATAVGSSPECNGTTHASGGGGGAGASTPTDAPALVCNSNPCPSGHLCIPELGNSSALFSCICPAGWEGPNCTDDVDECGGNHTNPCPPFSACQNRRGGFVCECPVGFYQDYPRGCLAAKTFLGNVTLKNSVFTADMAEPSSRAFMELRENITRVMNETFKNKHLSYQGTTVLNVTNGSVVVSVLHLFASTSAATKRSVNDAIRDYAGSCANTSACDFVRGNNFSYSEGDVCSLAVCDERSSRCVNLDGDVSCACRDGFFKHSPMDHVCRACENGYKLHNNTCIKCSFGYYGHQCEEGYLLVAVVLAAMGAGLLVNFAVALSVTCHRKRRLEAQRARYKDERFQLSPYAELPRIPRAHSAWGARETYEMQENGSTRNLLHPEESYIAPAYRSSVKTGESGQPYSVLPPGQYMYGGQHNPSYVHDDTRRRDYF